MNIFQPKLAFFFVLFFPQFISIKIFLKSIEKEAKEIEEGAEMSKSIDGKRISNQNKSGRKSQMTDVMPSLRKDLQNAKLFLQQSSNASGDSLYQHLSRVIAKVIDERPKDVVDYFELFSERVRAQNFQLQEMRLENAYKEPVRLEIAQRRLAMLISQSQHMSANVNDVNGKGRGRSSADGSQLSSESIANGNDEDEDEENDVIYEAAAGKDLCELQFYWNLFGIGFSREEVFSLSCSLRQLKRKNASIATCRFWGKIFGLQNDYYIAECTLTGGALDKRIVSFFSLPCSRFQLFY